MSPRVGFKDDLRGGRTRGKRIGEGETAMTEPPRPSTTFEHAHEVSQTQPTAAPGTYPERSGSLSLAPAIIARELPGWPNIGPEAGLTQGCQAYVRATPDHCEVTITQHHDVLVDASSLCPAEGLSRVLDFEVTAVCIDDCGMFRTFPDLLAHVEELVRRGTRVIVATEHATDEFILVTRLGHLRPQLLLPHTLDAQEVWDTVIEQMGGDALTPHQDLIKRICVCHPLLVHLFLTSICHVRSNDPVSRELVNSSLADAITHLVHTQFPSTEYQQIFLLHLALQGSPEAIKRVNLLLGADSLGASPIVRLPAAICHHRTTRDLLPILWQRLRLGIDPDVLLAARNIILSVLQEQLIADSPNPGILELTLGCPHEDLTPESVEAIRKVFAAADDEGRRRISVAIPELLSAHEPVDVSSRLSVLCSDVDMSALGVALADLCQNSDPPEATYDVLSPLVSLEYPTLAATLAEKGLEILQPHDPRTARVALAWIISSPATAITDAARRWHTLRRIVRLSRGTHVSAQIIRAGLAGLRAFTQRSTGTQLRELATQSGLSNRKLPALACCLAGLATCMNGMSDAAGIWCWRARSLAETHSTDYIWVLIAHAFVSFHKGDLPLAQELLNQAHERCVSMNAATTSNFCKVAIEFLRQDTGTEIESLLNCPHAVLHVFATHCVAKLNHQKGNIQQAIEGHFTVGRGLIEGSLLNPMLLHWRQELEEIFHETNEHAMADFLHEDVHQAEGAWRALNNLPGHTPTQDGSRGIDSDPANLLSSSEWRVVKHIAFGCTNAQAAAALFLSKRTVDTHLRNIYRRLGIASRSELIQFLLEHPAPEEACP